LGTTAHRVLYEVVLGADMVELHAAIEQAKISWPGTPLIACRRQSSGFQGGSWRSLDGATLKRLGFRAIADKAAQLPAILHEIEATDHRGTKTAGHRQPASQERPTSLPAQMKATSVRAAFDLVSSLHFIGDQTAPRRPRLPDWFRWSRPIVWTIYLFSDPKARMFLSSRPSHLEPDDAVQIRKMIGADY